MNHVSDDLIWPGLLAALGGALRYGPVEVVGVWASVVRKGIHFQVHHHRPWASGGQRDGVIIIVGLDNLYWTPVRLCREVGVAVPLVAKTPIGIVADYLAENGRFDHPVRTLLGWLHDLSGVK